MYALIIGYGFVGKSVARFLSKSSQYRCDCHEVSCKILVHDITIGTTLIDYLVKYSNDISIIFICLPTPESEDGSVNTKAIYHTVSILGDYLYEGMKVVLKSTVPPMTTNKLNKLYNVPIAFSPEFIGETKRSYKEVEDYPIHYCGGDPVVCEYLLSIYESVYEKLQLQLQFKIHFTEDLEVSKYMINCWLATKLSFCEEFYRICKISGARWESVKSIYEADPRVENSYTDLENIDKGFIFGGKCLPKDLAAMVNLLPGGILEAVKKSNKIQINQSLDHHKL